MPSDLNLLFWDTCEQLPQKCASFSFGTVFEVYDSCGISGGSTNCPIKFWLYLTFYCWWDHCRSSWPLFAPKIFFSLSMVLPSVGTLLFFHRFLLHLSFQWITVVFGFFYIREKAWHLTSFCQKNNFKKITGAKVVAELLPKNRAEESRKETFGTRRM